jgi:hypothetical protein
VAIVWPYPLAVDAYAAAGRDLGFRARAACRGPAAGVLAGVPALCPGGGFEGVRQPPRGLLFGSSGHKITARPAASWIAELSSSARVSATPYSSQDAAKVTRPSGGSG